MLTKEQVKEVFEKKMTFTVKGSTALAYQVASTNGAETMLNVLENIDEGDNSVVYAVMQRNGGPVQERWITGEVERMLEVGEFVAFLEDKNVNSSDKDAFTKLGTAICDLISHLDECESKGHMMLCLHEANELMGRVIMMAQVKAKNLGEHPAETLMKQVMDILKPRNN